MYKKIINAILVIVCLTAIVSLGGCTESQHKFGRNRIKEITEIEVPIDSKILFHYIPYTGFANGRQEQLTVFEFESEPTDWLKENKFIRSDDETKTEDGSRTLVLENQSYFGNYFKIDQIDEKGIPKEYVPNFQSSYFWIRTQNVYFFYYPETLMIIVYIAWS